MVVCRHPVSLALLLIALAPRAAPAAYERGPAKAAASAPSPVSPTEPKGPRNPFLESAIRQAAAAVFLGDAKTLQSLAVRVRAYEEANASQLEGFRLSDNLAELAAGLAPSRAARLEQMDAVARDADPEVKDALTRMKRDDPLLQARRLQWRQTWNRMASVVNYMTESAASLLNGNTQVLLKWTTGLLFSWRPSSRMSQWDRKRRALCREFLDRYPDDPQAPQVRTALARLDRKYQTEMAAELLQLSTLNRKAGNPDEALFYARKASEAGANAQSRTLKATQAQMRPSRDQAKALAIEGAGESEADGAERAQLQSLLDCLVEGDPERLDRQADEFVRAHPRSPFRDEAQYLRAVAAGWKGDRAAEESILDDLAAQDPSANMAVQARNLEDSRAANPDANYRAATAQNDRDTWRFILFGVDPPAEQLRLANEGQYESAGFYDYVSALLIVDGLIRALKTAFGAGPPDEARRDAAGALVRQDPANPRAKELAAWLGVRAEQRGQYAEALQHFQAAGEASEAKRAELRSKEARDIFARAQQIEDPALRQAYLEQASRELADTRYGAKAGAKALKAEEQQQVALDKVELAAAPQLWNGRGLRLDPAWFDGRPENGELADKGVVFFPPDFHDVTVYTLENGQTVMRRMRLEGPAYSEVAAALKERSLLTARSEAAADYERRRYVPLEIQGSAGGAGLLVYPTLLPYQMKPEDQALFR